MYGPMPKHSHHIDPKIMLAKMIKISVESLPSDIDARQSPRHPTFHSFCIGDWRKAEPALANNFSGYPLTNLAVSSAVSEQNSIRMGMNVDKSRHDTQTTDINSFYSFSFR